MEELIAALRSAEEKRDQALALFKDEIPQIQQVHPAHETFQQEAFGAAMYEDLLEDIQDEHDFQEHEGDYFKWEAIQLKRNSQ